MDLKNDQIQRLWTINFLFAFSWADQKQLQIKFPLPLTPSRRLNEDLLNNKNNESNQSINFCDASTSSALAIELESMSHQPLSLDGIESHLGKIVNLLAGPAFQLLSSEVKKRVADDPEQKIRPQKIME